MENETLRKQLADLHEELQQIDTVDGNERILLQQLATDLQELLDRDSEQQEHYQSLRERLNETIATVEASHPRATLLMRQVIDQLSFMGI
jgi:hypothetical protein